MPRLVGAQNPHRKVPRAARGGTHGVRVSQSSQHPSQTRPSSTLRLSLSAPALVSRSLSHPLSDPFPAGEIGRKGLIFVFNEEEGNKPFLQLQLHKETGGMIPLGDRKSRLARRLRGTGVGAAAGHVRGGAAGWPRRLPACFCGARSGRLKCVC